MQINNPITDFIADTLLTTLGDIIKRGASDGERMAIGAALEVLRVNAAGTDLEYADSLDFLTNVGDIIKEGSGGAARMARGAALEVLRVNAGATDLEYGAPFDILSTQGDLIQEGASGPKRFGVGAPNSLLKVNGAGNDIGWGWPVAMYTEAFELVSLKIIPIGDWDMDGSSIINVAHGLTYANIIDVSCYIISDDSSARTLLNGTSAAGLAGGRVSWTSTNISLTRVTGGRFDSTFFNATSFNRGKIFISYHT